MGDDPDDTQPVVTTRSARPRRQTEPGTPRAIAHGSGQLDAEAGSIDGGAVAAEVEPLVQPRQVRGQVTFGGSIVKVEHHGADVAIALPDGSLLVGSDEEACELAALLLGSATRRF